MEIKHITYNKLRTIKDALPSGSLQRIATDLSLTIEQVRSYFGGGDSESVAPAGFHVEPGPDGGIVLLHDREILDYALQILREELNKQIEEEE